MLVKHANPAWRIFDYILLPFMWFLGKFSFPVQETHLWHMQSADISKFPLEKGVLIEDKEENRRFHHDTGFGLFHMPIFGGLTQYVVLEVEDFTDHWHVAWVSNDLCQIHKLKIKNNKIKLLVGIRDYYAFGLDDQFNFLPIKISGRSIIGDRKYNNVRLF